MIVILNSELFGKNLRYLRLKRRISQKMLAGQCGVSVCRIRRIESGDIRDIEDTLLSALCSSLDADMNEMVFHNMEPNAK